ncbi:MAG: DUF6607 family protein, partial [Sphingomonas sp.]
MFRPMLAALLLSPLLPAAPAQAAPQAVAAPAPAPDRAAILGMAGDYRVTFDMRETTPWRADYAPIPAKISGGHEMVRVIEDSGRRIVLQHLLVVGHGGQTHVVKHWRQDWTYEPTRLLAYAGPGRWTLTPVPAADRAGRWSQTVWQTDDSPRYGGLGRWRETGGVRQWTSDETWRPLARRDAVRKPPYDRYLGVNRHGLSSSGWIHWQDNLKMGSAAGGAVVPYVQESVLNTYARDADFDVKAGEAYWTATRDYWAAIRAAWDAAIAAGGGVTVAEVADTGSASGERL